MSARRIGLACPLCDQEGVTSHLYEVPPSLVTLCESGNPEHRWTDTNLLRQANPRKLDLPKPAPLPQRDCVQLTVQLPAVLDTELRAKYGETLNSNIVSLLRACTQPEVLLLTSEDLDRIQERTKTRPTSGSEIFGMLFQQGEELQDLRTEVKRLERAAFMRKAGTGVMVDLGEFLPKAVGKAQEAEMTVDEYLSQFLRTSVENDWITV